MKDKLKKIDFVKGTSKKTGRPFYRVDVYFNTLDNQEYRKSFFMSSLEVMVCGLQELFH